MRVHSQHSIFTDRVTLRHGDCKDDLANTKLCTRGSGCGQDEPSADDVSRRLHDSPCLLLSVRRGNKVYLGLATFSGFLFRHGRNLTKIPIGNICPSTVDNSRSADPRSPFSGKPPKFRHEFFTKPTSPQGPNHHFACATTPDPPANHVVVVLHGQALRAQGVGDRGGK